MSDSRFRVFQQFNKAPGSLPVKLKKRMDSRVGELLEARGQTRRILDVLASEPCIKTKEVLESFEVHAVCRRRLVNTHIIDLCCGHGLTGFLFLAFNPSIETLTLLDRSFSKVSYEVEKRFVSEFPELQGKVQRLEMDLENFKPPKGDVGFLAIHACGSRTDSCLDIALEHQRPVVVMPCCYTGTGKEEPYALKSALGVPVSTDVGRTYRLHQAGYDVQWESISQRITPMNRVMIAHPVGTSPAFRKPDRVL